MTVAASLQAHVPALELSSYQKLLCSIPEHINIAQLGGKGGGKTHGSLVLAARHIVQYGPRARVLFLRRTHMALTDAIETARDIFSIMFGSSARFNANEGTWRFAAGGIMQFDQLETHDHLLKFMGKSYTLVLVDEVTHWPAPDSSGSSQLRVNRWPPSVGIVGREFSTHPRQVENRSYLANQMISRNSFFKTE